MASEALDIRKRTAFWMKFWIIMTYLITDIVISYVSFPIFFGRIGSFYGVRLLMSIIAIMIFIRMVNKWVSGIRINLVFRSIFILALAIGIGNIIEVTMDHIVNGRMFYQTLFSYYIILIYTLLFILIMIWMFGRYSRRFSIEEQTNTFYFPLNLKINVMAFLVVIGVATLLIGNNIRVEDRNAVYMDEYEVKFEVARISDTIRDYFISLEADMKHNSDIVLGAFVRNQSVDEYTLRNQILNGLNLNNKFSKAQFSYVSITIESNYSDVGTPISIEMFSTNNTHLFTSSRNLVAYRAPQNSYRDLYSTSESAVSFVNLNNDNSYLTLFKTINYSDTSIGYIQMNISANYIKNLITKTMDPKWTYILYNLDDKIIYDASSNDIVGINVDSLYNSDNWYDFITRISETTNQYMAGYSEVINIESTKMVGVSFYLPYLNTMAIYYINVDTILQNSQVIFKTSIVILFTLVFIIISAVIFSFIISRFLLPLKLANRSTESLKDGSGDLRQRIVANSNDELGLLIYNFNLFIDGLDKLIGGLKQESYGVRSEIITLDNAIKDNSKRISDQSASITESVASVNNIIDSISNVGRSTDQQRHAFSSASIAVEELLQTIYKINDNMERQASAVEETSASIEEMISNITSVAKSVNKADSFSKKLLDDARGGGDTVDEVIEAIRGIEESSDQIKEIINVIQGIAEQTNLLAMNAAIEAAHAGEQGKGFSVVADEIRSLAEHTAENTKSITTIIKGITKRVEKTVGLATESGKSLENILDMSGNTARVVSEINTANSELEIGGRDILETLRHLNNITNEVKENVKEQMNSGDVVDSQITLLDQITREVSEVIESNTLGAKDIVNAMSFLNDLSEKTREGNEGFSNTIKKLNINFNRFNSLIENFITEEDSKRGNENKDSSKPKKENDFDIDELMLEHEGMDVISMMDGRIKNLENELKKNDIPLEEDDILKMLQEDYKDPNMFKK